MPRILQGEGAERGPNKQPKIPADAPSFAPSNCPDNLDSRKTNGLTLTLTPASARPPHTGRNGDKA